MTKIGITENWFSRSTALKLNKETKCLGLFSPPEALKAEREIHHHLRDFRLPGSEYFKLSPKQQSVLIDGLCQRYRVEKDLSLVFAEYKAKKTIDITKCVKASAYHWLRLNEKSWKYFISDLCGGSYQDAPERSRQICSEQIVQIARIIASDWGMGVSQNIAARAIAEQLFLSDSFTMLKSSFARHRLYSPERFQYRLKPHIDRELTGVVKHHPGSRPLVARNVEIMPETVDVLLQWWISYSTDELCEKAMTCLMDRTMFGWYLSNYGPIP